MEGPTPVSALIHAATMVTAGVFLIIRCSFFFEYSELCLNLIILIGSLTAFFAATTGLFQNDIKKIIAYSTCSQLGYMIFACGLSSYETALFHLSNHAFFKALLFLSAGSVIHAINDEQDIRKMGGLKNFLPFTYIAILIGSLALTGFPFLAGFFSKESILEIAYAKHNTLGFFSYFLGSFAAFFTAFYSIRLLFLVFLANPNGNRIILLNAHESSLEMSLPLFILIFFSIFVGYLTKDFFIGFGTDFWIYSIFVLPDNYTLIDIEFQLLFFQLFPFILSLLGIYISYLLYAIQIKKFFLLKQNKLFYKIYNFLNKRWYIDRIYNEIIAQFVLYISYDIGYKLIDRGFLEYFGPFSLAQFVTESGYKVKQLYIEGMSRHFLYVSLILVGNLFFFIYLDYIFICADLAFLCAFEFMLYVLVTYFNFFGE